MGRLPNLKAQRPEENNQRKTNRLYIGFSLIILKYIETALDYKLRIFLKNFLVYYINCL